MFKNFLQKPSPTYLGLLLIFIAVYLWRVSEVIWINGVSEHVSNFAITGALIMLSIGPKKFELPESRKEMFQLSAAYIVINVVLEFLNIGDLPLPGVTFKAFNTADPIDAVYGIAAILLINLMYFKKMKTARLAK